ncbi:MAG: putative membrane protein YgcG [Cognaticolwellia sp.]|jgi:uncharacterized membrane protein YgcG
MLLFVSTAWGTQVESLRNPLLDGRYVSDDAQVISAFEMEQLHFTAQELDTDLGVRLVLVTVARVEEGSSLDLGLALAERWGLNDTPEENDLLLLLVSSRAQTVTVSGRGLQPILTPEWEHQIAVDYVEPELFRGQFGSAMVRWLYKLDLRLREQTYAARHGATAWKFSLEHAPEVVEQPWWFLRAVGVLGFSAGLGALAYTLVQRRFCFNHSFPLRMRLVDEAVDQDDMSELQALQDSVQPERHQVLRCPICGDKRVISRELGR